MLKDQKVTTLPQKAAACSEVPKYSFQTSKDDVDQGSANFRPWAKSGPLPFFGK